MNFKPVFRSIAAIALLFAATEARADTMYYNVDSGYGGPISVVETSPPPSYGSGLETLTLKATNTSATQTFSDVEFLNEFLVDTSHNVAMSFNTGTDVWSDPDPLSANTWQFTDAAGTLSLGDTIDVPTSVTTDSVTANLTYPTDAPPYFTIGTLAPGGSMTFTEIAQITPATEGLPYHFDLVGVAVSPTQPVPEPSTLALLFAGAIGALFFVGNSRRVAAI